MKLLIIGSKGFIGTHAMTYFRSLGCSVMGCDVVTDYTSTNYFQIDATNSDYHSLFERNQFDACINCSGAASVPQSLEFPLRDFSLNTLNVFKILEAIRLYQPQCKFLNLSSAAVYGNPTRLPITETAELKPLSPYGIHKMQAEQIVQEFHHFYGIASCSLRIFSAFGNGLRKQIFWDMYQKFKDLEVVELYGTGKESRDFIHVDDIVRACHLVLDRTECKGEAINIANGEEFSIASVAELFRCHFGNEKRVVFNNQVKPGDPLNWRADITRLKALGYTPTVSVDEGIRSYIRWAQSL